MEMQVWFFFALGVIKMEYIYYYLWTISIDPFFLKFSFIIYVHLYLYSLRLLILFWTEVHLVKHR